jgi:NADH:ubiquinone oxidoreductase subunit E
LLFSGELPVKVYKMMSETERISQILDRFTQIKRNALIPLLQAVQEEFGYIPGEAIGRIGTHLSLPSGKVYGLATFYNQFTFQPGGLYHITLCNGSSCHLAGSREVLGEITRLLEIGDGETTRDRLFSLELQSCLGACGHSPVMSINGTYYPGITVKQVREIIKQYREDASR